VEEECHICSQVSTSWTFCWCEFASRCLLRVNKHLYLSRFADICWYELFFIFWYGKFASEVCSLIISIYIKDSGRISGNYSVSSQSGWIIQSFSI